MRPLDLDFRSIRPASRWAGWLLLGLSVAFAADLGASYVGVRDVVARTEERLARLDRALDGTGRAGAVPASFSAEEVAFARETFERLTTPWEDLFGTLEAMPTDRVALLAIEPDPASGKVVISGAGKDYLAVLTYVLELHRAKTLKSVHLIKHERRQNDPQRPVGFSVSASWSKGKR